MSRPWNGKLLRVNLSTGRHSLEEIPSSYYELFMGGRGLGAALLYDEVIPGADPLDPEQNRLIFSTGPLTGMGSSGTAKCVVHCLSPLTGIYLFSVSSKSFGVRLKKAGYDALILQGRAKAPSVLTIDDDEVVISQRPDLWGQWTDQAEATLLQELGEKRFSVAIIGPAGENQVRYASIVNDGGRAFGRGGAGAVMGAMNLKAVAVTGNGKVEAINKEAWKAALSTHVTALKNNPRVPHLHEFGTAGSMDAFNYLGFLPVRNFQSNDCEFLDVVGPEGFKRHKLKTTTCPPCVVACTQWTHGTTSAGEYVVSEGPEYETLYAFGTACDVREYPSITQADRLCDQLGLDSMSAGLTLACVMECQERGLITADDTGGLDIRFGNGALVPELLKCISNREGFGDLMAEGSARVAAKVGQGAEHFAMQVKGMELGGYDPRAAKGMALVYAAGPRGGCHHAGGRTITEECRPDGHPFREEGKADLTRRSRAERIAYDCSVICTFNPSTQDQISSLLSAALGGSVTPQDLSELAERVSNLERLFNARQGMRRKHDVLPGRLLHDPVLNGPAKGQTVNLQPMLDEFYGVCGWDLETGLPLPTTLRAQGLERWANDAEQLLTPG